MDNFKWTHLDEKGALRMVDVSAKPPMHRVAIAEGWMVLATKTREMMDTGVLRKGNVWEAARLAGILAAKRTGDLIPLCHPLPITHCSVVFEWVGDRLRIEASASITAATGVEMEALTAVSVAALTLYDMCKAVDKDMRIEGIRLVSKTKTPAGQPGD